MTSAQEPPARTVTFPDAGMQLPRRRRRRATVAEDVASQLRDEIRDGVLRPGDHLRQNETAERLEVSVTPVREAFVILQREGLVERFHQRGVVVFQPTVEDIAACFEIRAALEGLAAQLAAEQLSDEQLLEMRTLLAEMVAAVDDLSRYVELNAAFHHKIEVAAGLPRLTALIDEQRVATNAYVVLLGGGAAAAQDTASEHQRIFDALQARDGKAADEAMAEHLRARKVAILHKLSA